MLVKTISNTNYVIGNSFLMFVQEHMLKKKGAPARPKRSNVMQDARAVRLQNPVKTRYVRFALFRPVDVMKCSVFVSLPFSKILGFHFVMTRDMNISAEWPCAIYILCSHKNLVLFFLIPDHFLTSI